MSINLDRHLNVYGVEQQAFNEEKIVKCIIGHVNYKDFSTCSKVSKLMNQVTERLASLKRIVKIDDAFAPMDWSKCFEAHILEEEIEKAFSSLPTTITKIYIP